MSEYAWIDEPGPIRYAEEPYKYEEEPRICKRCEECHRTVMFHGNSVEDLTRKLTHCIGVCDDCVKKRPLDQKKYNEYYQDLSDTKYHLHDHYQDNNLEDRYDDSSQSLSNTSNSNRKNKSFFKKFFGKKESRDDLEYHGF